MVCRRCILRGHGLEIVPVRPRGRRRLGVCHWQVPRVDRHRSGQPQIISGRRSAPLWIQILEDKEN